MKRINLSFTLQIISIFMIGVVLQFSSCAPKTPDDCGFQQNVYGQRISWKNKLPVDLVISSSIPVELKSAIYRAANSWERTLGKKAFNLVEENLQNSALPGRDKKNGIYFLKNWESDKKTEQGRTSVYWAGDEIQEADIRINAYNFSYYNENAQQLIRAENVKDNSAGYSFEALVLHEMGHFLGLKHKEESGSVMATYLSANTDRVQPAAVDSLDTRCEYQ